jgi:hypothetical protein
MLQGTPGRVSDYYDRHPINEARVLEALSRPGLGRPTADDLFEFDQDHYGGLAAVDALARRAGIGATSRVLDVCAGLGGPARFVADRRARAAPRSGGRGGPPQPSRRRQEREGRAR